MYFFSINAMMELKICTNVKFDPNQYVYSGQRCKEIKYIYWKIINGEVMMHNRVTAIPAKLIIFLTHPVRFIEQRTTNQSFYCF